MSAGSMGYVVFMSFVAFVLQLFLVHPIVVRTGSYAFRTMTNNESGATKRRLGIVGSFASAAVTTLIFWVILYFELGSKEFRDIFG